MEDEMKKLWMVTLLLLMFTTVGFTESEEIVEGIVPETLFVNGVNNVFLMSDAPVVEVDDTYYLPISAQFLMEIGRLPIWNEEGTSLEVSGMNIDMRQLSINQRDPYLVDYKRPIQLLTSEPIDIVFKGDSKEVTLTAVYKNAMSEVWYVPLTEELADLMHWEYYDLENFGQFLYLYDFNEEDRELFMAYQRKMNAMAKYMTIINKRLDYERAAYYVQLVEKTSQKYDVPTQWIMAIMWQESWYDESCTYINAVGMMQMLKSTGKSMGVTPEQLLDPAINIDVCVNYLARDRRYFDGDLELAIHAYNQGSFRVVKNTHKTWYYEEVAEKYGKIGAYIEKKVAGL